VARIILDDLEVTVVRFFVSAECQGRETALGCDEVELGSGEKGEEGGEFHRNRGKYLCGLRSECGGGVIYEGIRYDAIQFTSALKMRGTGRLRLQVNADTADETAHVSAGGIRCPPKTLYWTARL